MKVSKYRRAKPETPGSRIYWTAFQRYEEHCELVAYKQHARIPTSPKPFYKFIIEEIDAALQRELRNP